MDRIIRIDERALDEALKLTPQERIRQANSAFRLYHSLHHPYDKPQIGETDNPVKREITSQEGRLST